MTTVDLLVQMLAEEREAAKQARLDRANANATLMRAQRSAQETEDDLHKAMQKIEEWVDYSQSWHPLIPAKRRKELKPPQAYTRGIPF